MGPVVLRIPFTMMLAHEVTLVLRPEQAIPIGHLHRGPGQPTLDVHAPASQAYKSSRISFSSPYHLVEGAMQRSGIGFTSLCWTQHLQRCALIVVPLAVSPVWQSVVITDESTVNFDGFANPLAS